MPTATPIRPDAFACDPTRGYNLRHTDLMPFRDALQFLSASSEQPTGATAIGG